MDLTRFREQHQAILNLGGELGKIIGDGDVGQREAAARDIIARLAGKVKIHLTLEDDCLYPRLASHSDAGINDVATRFMNEMGGIAKVFVAYVEKWRGVGRISAEANAFASETRGLLSALKDRIDREDTELYPLAEKVGH